MKLPTSQLTGNKGGMFLVSLCCVFVSGRRKGLHRFPRNLQKQVEQELNGVHLNIAATKQSHNNQFAKSHAYAGVSLGADNSHLP
jgi:hypothetical protein